MEVYYIGGSPCSGKSTIAEMLTARHGLGYYKLDDFLWDYMKRAAEEGKPHSAAALALDTEGMWMRPPRLQCDEELAIYEELLPYALEEIRKMSAAGPVLAEGAGFLPRLMAAQGVAKNRYLCIVPTEAFQRDNYARRPWINEFLEGCSRPEVAFDNWMSRDALFAVEVVQQARQLGYSAIVVDGSVGVEENSAATARVFGLHERGSAIV